jgi:hypothetical protein
MESISNQSLLDDTVIDDELVAVDKHGRLSFDTQSERSLAIYNMKQALGGGQLVMDSDSLTTIQRSVLESYRQQQERARHLRHSSL